LAARTNLPASRSRELPSRGSEAFFVRGVAFYRFDQIGIRS
jgi:hypothetical protein